MRRSRSVLQVSLLIFLFNLIVSPSVFSQRSVDSREAAARPIIWRHPGNVRQRDLQYGPGAAQLAPVDPFTFVEEDKSGESPKFIVRDGRGIKWTVKLGPEAQAETVSTRLIWAVGYFAEEAYYLEDVQIHALPRLTRGQDYVSGNTVRGARFEPKRPDMKRGQTWSWQNNPFADSRELSGLKVLMILLNNFDARSENNRVIYVDGPGGREVRYYVTDLGATLGRAGGLGGTRTKNDLADFLSTKFVRGIDERDGVVEFDYDTRPRGFGHFSIVYYPYYRHEVSKEKAMRGIPIAHARWIGSLLNQLSDEQLHDAFRAAGYSDGVRQSYVGILRERINQLVQLPKHVPQPSTSAGVTTKIKRFNSRAVDKVETTASTLFTRVRSTIRRRD